jgi:hypothetical protein
MFAKHSQSLVSVTFFSTVSVSTNVVCLLQDLFKQTWPLHASSYTLKYPVNVKSRKRSELTKNLKRQGHEIEFKYFEKKDSS